MKQLILGLISRQTLNYTAYMTSIFCHLCVAIIITCPTLSTCFMDTKIIEKYFKEKFVKQANILTCYNKRERVELLTSLINQQDVMISVTNIEHINILDSLVIKNHRLGAVIDSDCPNTGFFLQKCSKYKLFGSKHNWLILSSTKNYTHLLENLNINVDSDIHVAYPNLEHGIATEKNYTVEDVYNPAFRRGGFLNISPLGFYNEKIGYKARQRKNKYFLRRDLSGITFKTMVVLPVPFNGSLDNYLASNNDREINTFNRFHARLMSYCGTYHNFSMKIGLGKSWGYLKQDGTMDGMVGELERHNIDFGISPLFVKTQREKFMLYGRKTWTLRAAFIFKNPKSRKSFEIFIKPLSQSVWLLIVISGAISTILLKLSSSYEQIKMRKHDDASNFSYVSLCIFGAFCQQGVMTTPNVVCGRIAMIFTFLLSVIVYQFYSASLVSFLLNVPSTPLTSLKDLLSSNMKGGCEDILYDKDYFMYTTDNITKKLYKKWIVPNDNKKTNYFSPEKGLELVRGGQYAFHVELATAYPIIAETFDEKSICDLREIPMFGTKPMHANYPKGSPFRDIMDTCLHRFAENGVMDREIRFWHPKKPECVRSPKTIAINTGLQDFYPALVLLGVGILLSMQILILEVFINYKNNKLCREKQVYPFVK